MKSDAQKVSPLRGKYKSRKRALTELADLVSSCIVEPNYMQSNDDMVANSHFHTRTEKTCLKLTNKLLDFVHAG